jgi:hypothetical protein
MSSLLAAPLKRGTSAAHLLLQREAAASTIPFVWTAIALWGVFIVYRIVIGTRRGLRV